VIIKRKKTYEIRIGSRKLGSDNPILVQSMTKSKNTNEPVLRKEVSNLLAEGCEIIRIAITDYECLKTIRKFVKEGIFSNNPLVADIQFDHGLAVESLEAGADCVRINPGNIGGIEKTKTVMAKAIEKKACIRIGVNSGSVEKKFLKKNQNNVTNAIVESTLEYVRLFENSGFYNFKVSAKASSVTDTIDIYKKLSEKIRYPLHLGITEAGSDFVGSIKSAIGIGILLYEGIGDTIRVSLTADSSKEVKAGYAILASLGLRNFDRDIISCPTCGRTKVDLKNYVSQIEEITEKIKRPLKIAVMGCIVNGPGEAKEADIGIAFGEKKAAVFVKGKVIKRVMENEVIRVFTEELYRLLAETNQSSEFSSDTFNKI